MLHERVLIVDDDPEARSALASVVKLGGYEVGEAGSGPEALSLLETFIPAVVLTDLRMPKMDGFELIRRARSAGSQAVFIVLTAHATIEAAVEAMRFGAENFLLKASDVDATLLQIEKALEKRKLQLESQTLRQRLRAQTEFPDIIGESAELKHVLEVVRQAAATRATVLILGESGTGKELVAEAIHELSPRRQKAFVKLNCAALADSLLESELFGHEKGSFTGAISRKSGRFERADGGTLFLDEIGEISPATQVKLLRALQTREFERVGGTETVRVDVRLVAATNRDLASEVAAGRFREDLYYRLNVVTLTMPPLRQRKGDIQALVNHFLGRFSDAYHKRVDGLTPAALDALLLYDWPGNVRELENALERAIVLCRSTKLTLDDLPPSIQSIGHGGGAGPMIPGATLYDIERHAILRTLEAVGGSTTRAAEVLGISVRKVQYKLKEYAALGDTIERRSDRREVATQSFAPEPPHEPTPLEPAAIQPMADGPEQADGAPAVEYPTPDSADPASA